MTEAEWLACTDPQPMLVCLGGQASRRRLRLFACACCRRIDNLLTDKGKEAVAAAERFADGLIGCPELHRAWAAVGYPKREYRRFASSAARAASCSPGYDGTAHAAASALNAAVQKSPPPDRDVVRAAETVAQASLLREIFPNPFSPVKPDPHWLTPTVTAIAEDVYEDQAFGLLPILADALEDAGCHNEAILTHLRIDNPHLRGCWPIDLILGKS